jgi:uncharacterized surface protein with fasciclin (FAS1) repeats
MNIMRKRRASIVAAFAALAIVGAACSSDDGGTSTAGGDDMTTPSEVAAPMNETFGAGCAAVPADGAGSFDGMASDPVATAASNNPALSQLVTLVGAANLGDTLNSAEDITVFAPANEAIEGLPQKTAKAAMADPSGLLTDVLTYHVVPGRLAPEDLAGTHETLQGSTLEVSGMGESFTVNGDASVVCGNVQTANATVYVIDTVMMPPAA